MHAFDLPLHEQRRQLDAQMVSSTELADICIARATANQDLNAWSSFNPQALRDAAREADRRLAAGERLPLLGIPMALKDNIEATGFPCGAGTAALAGQAPRADAEVVTRLKAAGAVIAGKLGMHELAMGITSHNAVTGAVRNPWDRTRSPGGSSGGSGAAVGAHQVPAALGTDTGGSIRIPAALCGVTGFRPTVGRYANGGIAPISTTRDTAGPLAATVADCALIDAVLTGTPVTHTLIGQQNLQKLKGLRIGLPRAPFWRDLEPGVQTSCESALNTLSDAGVEWVEVELPGLTELCAAASFPIVLYEFVRDMRAYLQQRNRGVSLEELITQVRSPDVRQIVGPLLSGGGIAPAAYRAALTARAELQALYARAFETHRVQALAFPTTARTAARIGEDETVDVNGVQIPTFSAFIRQTDPGSTASLPGISLPAGLSNGLPVGLALDGPIGSDQQLLAIAEVVQAALPPAPQTPIPA